MDRITSIAAFCLLLTLPTFQTGCEQNTDDSMLIAIAQRVFSVPEETPDTASEKVELAAPTQRNDSIVIIEADDVSTVDDPETVPSSKAFYRYVDASGRDHLVQGLHNIPAQHQPKAAKLSGNQGRSINRYDAASVVRQYQPKVVASSFNPNRLDVTLYGATWCGACRRAKQLLDREGISYIEYDIDEDEDAREEVRSILGNVKIPLLDINGTYIAGYERDAIMRLVRGG